MSVFKIRDNRTGLFMTKTKTYPVWTTEGHVYNTKRGCRSAIKSRKQYFTEGDDRLYITIVEFDLVQIGADNVWLSKEEE